MSVRTRVVRLVSGRPSESRPRSMRAHLIWMWVAAAVTVMVATAYGFAWSSDRAGTEAVERMTFRAERAATSVSAAVDESRAAVDLVAATPDLDQVFVDAEGCALTAAREGPFVDIRLDLVSRDGRVACSSDPTAVGPAPVHRDSAWLDAALVASKTAVTWNGTDPVTGDSSVVVAVPFGGTQPRPAGAAVMFLHPGGTATALSEDLLATDRATVTIVDRTSGAVVATSAGSGATEPRRAADDFRAAGGQWAGLDGTQRFFGSADVTGGPWRIYTGADRSAVLADARGTLARQGLVGLLALLLLAVTMIVLDRRVAGPLRAVTAAVAVAGRHRDSAHVDVAGTSEVVALARQFNSMLDLRAGQDAQLLHHATHDPLTGLPNAGLLRERLHQSLLSTPDDSDLAVLCLGLDRFKNVNDGLGHHVGDRVLREVAERIAAQLRPHDTLARFGGDQFVLVCENTGADGAISVVERLQLCFQHPFHAGESDIVLRASLGIAITEHRPEARPRVTGSVEQLLREAGSAMQQAKAGGGGWRVFSGDTQERAARHLVLERELQDALHDGELVVYFQPVLDVVTGRIVGAEALVRWQHPTRGLVPPSDFIPVAEQTGQIGAIGAYVLTHACRHAAAWSQAGHPLRMSVNVAVGQLTDPSFPGLVERALAVTGLPADQLCLEITESSIFPDDDEAMANLRRLRALGVHLSVDDFGTGNSSLAYLHQLPVDEVKVDRSFISRLCEDARYAHLVEAMIRMAHALDLSVVAEGVETADQLDALGDLHCDRVQGFLLAAPETAQRFRDRLRAGGSRAAATAGLPTPTAGS